MTGLIGYRDPGGIWGATASVAYSTAQQLVTTAWNITFAVILTLAVFGWTGGKQLVTTSYEGAKEQVAEQKEARRQRKEEKKAAKEAGEERQSDRFQQAEREPGETQDRKGRR